MDAGLYAAIAGFSGVALGKTIDLIITRNKSKPVEASLMNKRLEAVDKSIIDQRQQYDESTARFRLELQNQINTLQAEVVELNERNKKLTNENIAFTFKIAELEYKLRLAGGSSAERPTSITTEVTATTTTATLTPPAPVPEAL